MNRQSIIRFLKKFGAGAFIGLASIVPGVSGGVIAVVMGLYESTLEAITNFFQNPRRNILFLLPLGLGAGFGVLVFSNLIAWLMEKCGEQVIFLFIGFVVGGIPALFRKANSRGFRAELLIFFIIGLIIILLPAQFELIDTAGQEQELNFSMALLSGFILALGTIVPGMSSSFILIYLGSYEGIIRAISTIDIVYLFPVGIGFLLGALMIIKIVAYLFKHFQAQVYYVVLGLLIGSILLIVPPLSLDYKLLINILLFALGSVLAYFLERNM